MEIERLHDDFEHTSLDDAVKFVRAFLINSKRPENAISVIGYLLGMKSWVVDGKADEMSPEQFVEHRHRVMCLLNVIFQFYKESSKQYYIGKRLRIYMLKIFRTSSTSA